MTLHITHTNGKEAILRNVDYYNYDDTTKELIFKSGDFKVSVPMVEQIEEE